MDINTFRKTKLIKNKLISQLLLAVKIIKMYEH